MLGAAVLNVSAMIHAAISSPTANPPSIQAPVAEEDMYKTNAKMNSAIARK
ncbi:hypothetical protein [Pseudoxanthomonas sp. LjRoot143]|uniref:hypothetical protein n=1 Tax=Pseudoxanthomonas sp. LjRoot143 TaxID=3342266 RepID=UPI003F502405